MTTITVNIDFETLSHELRTPLTGILGIVALMENQHLSGDMKEKIIAIHQAGNRLLFIVNKLLTKTNVKAHLRN